MYLFDLHCDTVSECYKKNKSLMCNDLHIDISRENHIERWAQVFALWLDDSYRGEQAYNHFLNQYSLLSKFIDENTNMVQWGSTDSVSSFEIVKCNAIAAVEGGHVLGGKISRIEELSRKGILYLTLVWNSSNELGSGTGKDGNSDGLTSIGMDAVRELERCGVLVDVSHLNEAGFRDVCRLATEPFIASHSNAWEKCNHPRNLKDYQIKSLIEVGGLCGINLYPLFVNGTADCEYDDIIRHIDHILKLGGEHVLAIGTDFDGANMPSSINGVQTLYRFYDYMLKWYGKDFADKLFYNNASDFYKLHIHNHL